MSVVSALAHLHERIGALESGMGVWGAFDYVRDRETGTVDRAAERELRINFGLVHIFNHDISEFLHKMTLTRIQQQKGDLTYERSLLNPVDQIKIYLISTQATREAVIFLQYNFNNSAPYLYISTLNVEGRITEDPPTFHETTSADYAQHTAASFVNFRVGHPNQFELEQEFVDDNMFENSPDYADRGDGSKFQTAYQLVYTDAPRTPPQNELTFYTPPSRADREQMRRRFYIEDAKQMRFFWSLLKKLSLH